MNTTRTHRKVIAAALIAALAGSLAACSTPRQTDSTFVGHGSGELSAYLQIQEQIQLERERLRPRTAVVVIQDDIRKERERLQQAR